MKLLHILLLLSTILIVNSLDDLLQLNYPTVSPSVIVPSIPHISREYKWELIRQSGQDPMKRRRSSKGFRTDRARRLAPWHRIRPLGEESRPPRPTRPPRALIASICPPTFDAVTRGSNGRTYLFSGDRVYQSWIEDGLPQKASYAITEMFNGGPSSVTAVSTNTRSGVTTLFYGRTSYRFRWNNEAKRFHIARNSPKQLNSNITLTPSAAFEWKGHQVLLNGGDFITFDAYWNIGTFASKTSTYFPGIPRDPLGILLDRGTIVFFYTKRNTVQVYDRIKHMVAAEFPVSVFDYAGCLH